MKSFSSPVARSILDEPDVGQQSEAGEAMQDFETFFKAYRFALIAFLRRRTTAKRTPRRSSNKVTLAFLVTATVVASGYKGMRIVIWRSGRSMPIGER